MHGDRAHSQPIVVLRILRWLFVAVMVTLLVGCSREPAENLAKRAVEKFHSQLEAGEFHTIYAEADEEFRKQGRESEILDSMRFVHDRMGRIVQTALIRSEVGQTTSGARVTLSYSTYFEGGRAAEQFIWLIVDGSTKLIRYDINSPSLEK